MVNTDRTVSWMDVQSAAFGQGEIPREERAGHTVFFRNFGK